MQTDLIQIGGAGPAGLAAAITLAKAGRHVLVHEMQSEIGHRFGGDFQGLENWSTPQDALDHLREIGITTDFAMFPILVIMYVYLARREERDARAAFGEDYARYEADTSAFFPGVGKVHA
ncbi:MAG: NAD(P)-binding protein [Burkholderiaceae bacterium]